MSWAGDVLRGILLVLEMQDKETVNTYVKPVNTVMELCPLKPGLWVFVNN